MVDFHTTAEDLDSINQAIAKLQNGERVVQVAHNGHVVKYAEVELSELVKLRNQILVKLKKNKRRFQIITSKGAD